MPQNFLQEVIAFLKTLEWKTVTKHENILPLTENASLLLIPINESGSYLTKTKQNESNKKLIPLWEDQWQNNRTCIESRLRSILGKSERIHGRQTVVQKIDQNVSKTFLNENHLHGSTKARYKFGLFHKEELVAVMTVGSRVRFRNDQNSYDIIRYCTKNNYSIVGGLGKLIKFIKNDLQPDHLMTAIDFDWSDGKGFEKVGFTFDSITRPIESYIHLKTKKRYFSHRISPETIQENPKEWLLIQNSGNHKFTWEKESQ